MALVLLQPISGIVRVVLLYPPGIVLQFSSVPCWCCCWCWCFVVVVVVVALAALVLCRCLLATAVKFSPNSLTSLQIIDLCTGVQF